MKKNQIFRAIVRSIVFNFKHLPLKQAYKLPILIYKGKIKNSGTIIIKGDIKSGMIRLGFNMVSIFPNNGIILENRGKIVFNGPASIGNNSAISVNQTGLLEFGEGFIASSGLRIACYHHITFENRCLVGWNTMLLDTSFHGLTNHKTNEVNRKGFGPIYVGENVWIANGCKIYKGVIIPKFCVVGGDTILYKPIDCPPYSFITNKRDITIKTTGLYRNIDDDKLEYDLNAISSL